MDIPRGYAMLPLAEPDFLDFLFSYFKAEYSPIRSLWSTATAEPRQSHRWINMGHELSPLSFRPANAQAQKDLESLDYFVRQKNLDAGFVRGIVIRYAKYEVHERLEKKLYESCRLDLMVRKALKEKHLIDSLWPSPAPRNIPQELLKQGVNVRSWYGDMFSKYFRHLHSVDDFAVRPDVDARIKTSGQLILVPFVDHLVFGAIDPIMPIVAKGAGYSNAAAWKQKDSRTQSFGEPDQFEIRFDAPAEIVDTHTRSVVRQCQCLKCGTRRDVRVVVHVDPSPGPISHAARPERKRDDTTVEARRQNSKAAQRYSPGYAMPSTDVPPPQPPRPSAADLTLSPPDASPASPGQQKQKQCPRCTFLNHEELSDCEMCGADISNILAVEKPPSPKLSRRQHPGPSHSHSVSLPANKPLQEATKQDARPAPLNRHSLSSTLFSIFPFSQQQQTEHHANLPPTQPTMTETSNAMTEPTTNEERPSSKDKTAHKVTKRDRKVAFNDHSEAVRAAPDAEPSHQTTPSPSHSIHTPPLVDLESHPEAAMMPLTPDLPSERARPMGMPQTLMDDYVPVSPAYRTQEDDEDAGWGEMSREEARNEDTDDEEDEDEEGLGRRVGLVDLDAVALEEKGVWGDGDDEE